MPGKADLRVTDGRRPPAVLEVKGTRKNEFSKTALRQLNEWMEDVASEKLTEVKGIFVGNAAREGDPLLRPQQMFDSNNLDYAKFKKMVVVRSMDLYCAVMLAMLQRLQKEKFWDDLFSSEGAFDCQKYWEQMPAELVPASAISVPPAVEGNVA